MAAAPPYRNPVPYRSPASYRGEESVPGVGAPTRAAIGSLPWQQAAATSDSTSARFLDVSPHDLARSFPWDAIAPRSRLHREQFRQITAHDRASVLRWADTSLHVQAHAALPYLHPKAWETLYSTPYADVSEFGSRISALPWDSLRAQSGSATTPWGTLFAHGRSHAHLWRALVERGAYVALPWSMLAARSRDTTAAWPPTPPFDPDTILVPDLPVYIMLPTLAAVRLPDRTPIPLLSISLQADQGSYDWSFTAPMQRSGLALVNPDDGAAPEIEITINGFVWTFAVEGYDDNRRFGSNTLSLRGRSRSAQLAAPFVEPRTYTETEDRTAAQLAEQELPPGWSLVWDAVDWLIPGGTWSYQDLTPVEAIGELAGSIGAALRSHPAEKVLEVVPTYRDSPWAWDTATPFAILPAAIVADGSSSWRGGTNAEAVYVYAQNAPTGARVLLSGSAGASQLPMIVDRLLVEVDAQRERGRQALASAGRARLVQRTVPLFPTPPPPGMPDLGVVPLGALLEFEEDETWRGMVTAVRIDAQRTGRALSVRQHLTIERQYR